MAIKRPETKTNIVELAEESKGEKEDGVYLIGIEKSFDGFKLLPNDVSADPLVVDKIQINGQYVGVSDRMEVECRDYQVVDTAAGESAEDFHQWTLQITMGPEDGDNDD